MRNTLLGACTIRAPGPEDALPRVAVLTAVDTRSVARFVRKVECCSLRWSVGCSGLCARAARHFACSVRSPNRRAKVQTFNKPPWCCIN